MRLIEAIIPTGKRQTVLEVLDDEGIDYVVTDETSGREYTAIVSFPLPTQAVEPVLGRLREAGLDEEAYTVVLDAEAVLSRRFERLREAYAEREAGDGGRIAREEIHTHAEELAPTLSTYVVMTVISAVIATAGLLLDSPAIVVGSMVIAPIVGPALSASVGTVVDDQDMFRRGIKLQVLGLVLAIFGAAAFAALVKQLHIVPPGLSVVEIDQISERLRPDFLALAVAFGAGIAGALSLSTGVSTALVGVMIAAALIPPAATVGIGVAWLLPSVALGASVLVLVNLISINLAAVAVLWYSGYRPDSWFNLPRARNALVARALVMLAIIAVLSVFLGSVTYSTYQTATFEEAVRGEVEAALDAPAYEELVLIDTAVKYDDDLPFKNPRRVIITLGRPPGETYPEFGRRIDDRLEQRTGQDLVVQVQFVDVQQY